MFHGNDTDEHSFPFNKGFLEENFHLNSLMSQRCIHNFVINNNNNNSNKSDIN